MSERVNEVSNEDRNGDSLGSFVSTTEHKLSERVEQILRAQPLNPFVVLTFKAMPARESLEIVK